MAKIEINLLPRELRKRRPGISLDKSLTFVVGLAVVLVVAFVGINVFQSMKLRALNNKIAEAQRRAEELRKNIELVDALTDVKDKVLQRMSAIEALDRNRAVWVRVMEDLAKRVPDYLWLSLLEEEEPQIAAVPDSGVDSTTLMSHPSSPAQKRVTMEGYSYSLNGLASFLIELIGSPYFKNMELQYVKRAEVEERKTFTFQLVGDLYYVPDLEGLDADTAVHELASAHETEDSEMNLAAGRD
jgi:Tfp pilus assembly protein PilN